MRKGIWLAVAMFFGAAVFARAEVSAPRPGDLALGLILGAPTGASVKYWTNRRGAVDGALGFPFDSDVKLDLHSDYLWHFPLQANVPGQLPVYVGVGGRLRSIDKPQYSQKVDFGVRLPVGIEFSPNKLPLDFFAELAPVIVFTPEGRLDLDGGVGVRYRFSAVK